MTAEHLESEPGPILWIDDRRGVDQAKLANVLRRAGLTWRMSWAGDTPEAYTLEIYRLDNGEVIKRSNVRNGDDNLVSEFVDMVAECVDHRT